MKRGLVVTARDRQAISALQQCGLLTTAQIQGQVFSGIDGSTVLRRLRKLHRYGLVSKETGLHQGPLVWQATVKCAALVGDGSVYGEVNRNQLEHELMLSSIYLALIRHGVTSSIDPGFALKQRLMEKAQKERGRETTGQLIPDALFTIVRPSQGEGAGRAEVVALELELTAKSKGRYRAILGRYAKKQSLGLIWYVVPSRRLGETLCSIWNERRESSIDNRLVWSLTSDVLKAPSEVVLHSAVKSARLSEVAVLKPQAPAKLAGTPNTPCPGERPPPGQG